MSTPHYQQDHNERALEAEKHEEVIEYNEKFEAQKIHDYSGAAEKTDPAEIALVRKLDWFIMVSNRNSSYPLAIANLDLSLCFGACTG